MVPPPLAICTLICHYASEWNTSKTGESRREGDQCLLALGTKREKLSMAYEHGLLRVNAQGVESCLQATEWQTDGMHAGAHTGYHPAGEEE